jgi:hypothetical protein
MPHFGKGFMIRDLGNPGGSLRKLGTHQETLRSLIVIIAKEEKDRYGRPNEGRERTRDKEARGEIIQPGGVSPRFRSA